MNVFAANARFERCFRKQQKETLIANDHAVWSALDLRDVNRARKTIVPIQRLLV
jgi:hypothetical protein